MSTISKRFPGKLADLVRIRVPVAISNEKQYSEMVELADRLMALPRLTSGQAIYLETLIELIQYYESKHHEIDLASASPLETLKTLLDEHEMNASDLSRILGVHVSLGSKILKGLRALTLDHVKILAEYFHLSPAVFF
jgi:HTH-type transcriptional regulator/antitoxin HigA